MPQPWAELRAGMGKGFCSSCPPFPWSPGNEDKPALLEVSKATCGNLQFNHKATTWASATIEVSR